jgi:hypothetical protein
MKPSAAELFPLQDVKVILAVKADEPMEVSLRQRGRRQRTDQPDAACVKASPEDYVELG